MDFCSIRATSATRPIEATRRGAIKAAAALLALNTGGLMHGAHAAEDKAPPPHFACSFSKGTSSTYDKGQFQSVNAAALSFEVGDVNLEKQTASLIVSGKESETLRVVRALNGMHFIEVMVEGYINVTTVYDRDPATGKYPAVHSRHMAVLGAPLVAQYFGTCEAR